MNTSSILDELAELTEGHRYERYVACKCMFHDDSSPSMFIYEDSYHCSSCGAFGNTNWLLKKLSAGSSVQIISTKQEYVTNPFSRWTKDKSLGSFLKSAYEYLQAHIYFADYLISTRKIPSEVIKKLRVGYWDGFFTFPIISQENKVVGAFARSGAKDAKYRYFIPKDQDPNLIYCPDWKKVKDASKIYLTFGCIDSISLYLCGLPALSTTTGKRLDVSALASFRKEIVIIGDYGEDKEARRIASMLGWRGTSLIFPYPDDCKDMNNVWTKYPELIYGEFK